jgi:hypothetical protein
VKKTGRLILILAAGLTLTGFGSTKLVFTWTNPQNKATHFKNIMVVGINGKASIRAQFEDELCSGIARPGLTCTPSYALIPRPDGTPLEMDQLRDVVTGQKIDAIIASRLVKFIRKITYETGAAYPLYPAYSTFYGYYGAIAPVVYAPDYLSVERTAQVETNFYSTEAPDGSLVWTATSDTVNPHSPLKAVHAVSSLIAQELEKQKII